MRTRKEMKKAARQVLKKHYLMLVFACLFIAFIGTEFSDSVTFFRQSSETMQIEGDENVKTLTPVSELNALKVLEDMMESADIQVGEQESKTLRQQYVEDSRGKNSVLGRSRGVFADVVNTVTSGAIFVTIVAGINSVIQSENVSVMIFVLLSLLLMLAVWFFFKNMLSAVMRRIFLECRTYEKVAIADFVFFFRVKKWVQVSWNMFVVYAYAFLWDLTIIGGIIKHYSYIMVPYIVAENPQLKAREAITLSRVMMNGHKWECFKLDVSLIGWQIVGAVTGGLSNILFLNPYIVAIYAEHYAQFRAQTIQEKRTGYEALNDPYLFEKADQDEIIAAYADIIEALEGAKVEEVKPKGVLAVIAELFGVIPFYGVNEQKYEQQQYLKAQTTAYTDILERESYPRRMFAIPEEKRRSRMGQMRYLRRYSIWSVILLFFSFSLIGWLWEVSLHLVSDGCFVNRGVLHGPWLPIYGAGGVLILLGLNKLREKPALEFAAAIVLCGFVEYFTSYFLEKSHGQKWWDYSGYFLNLNGRICAEGLLVFGLGGVAIVYVAAPLLDNLFRRIQFRILLPLCLVLTCTFLVDQIYSGKHPNMGKGITDYQSRSVPAAQPSDSPIFINVS